MKEKKITLYSKQEGRKPKSNEKVCKRYVLYILKSCEFETEIIEFRNFKHTLIINFLIFEREVIRRFFKIPAYWVF